jgi:hypothetical protein
MAFEYHTHQGLFEIVNGINERFYKPASENIIYLEEISNENAIAYMVALRDAYSHLVKIFEFHDSLAHDNRLRIERQLERYSGHLERLLFDTYQKIISIKSSELWKILPDKEKPTIKSQVALEVKNQRVVDDGNTVAQKIEGYKNIIAFIENAYRKFIN